MFKYAPGMESGLGASLNMMRKHAEPDGDEGTTVTNIFNMEDKESGMNDIAGLMALMQNNKGMDLPGILALCQQKGYGREGGGWGDGMGLLVILLFFLMFNNGGWGTEIWRKRIRVTSMCRSRNSAICFSQFRISFNTFTRKLVKILKNARNCTTSFT